MPTYIYRALTKNGQEVKNKVEDSSRISLIKKLKNNGLMPISVIQSNIGVSGQRPQKKQKKNLKDADNILRKVNTANVENKRNIRKITLKERVTLWTASGEKITPRDLMIFTQNFYLLKKANFNNIHALNTIIESTEKLSFRGILEDILAGVEAGENMYVTMEYYTGVFPYIYINMIKVGELSRISYKIIRTSN